MHYRVGQILYVLSESTNQVFPIQVAEEIIRRTRDGDSVSYLVALPLKENDKIRDPVRLDKIKGEIFDTIDEIKEHLKMNALNAIESIVNRAKKSAYDSFDFVEERPDVPAVISDFIDDESENQEETTTKSTVILPDGQEATVTISESVEETLAAL